MKLRYIALIIVLAVMLVACTPYERPLAGTVDMMCFGNMYPNVEIVGFDSDYLTVTFISADGVSRVASITQCMWTAVGE